MAKQVLGRSLGSLLGDTKVPGPQPADAPNPSSTPPEPAPETPASAPSPALGHGVKVLLRGTGPTAKPQAEPDLEIRIELIDSLTAPEAPSKALPRAVYFFADLLFVAVAAGWVWQRPPPFAVWDILLCCLLIALGALCGILPFLTAAPVPRAGAGARSPKWILGHNNVTGPLSRTYVIHLHEPRLIGEVSDTGEGKRSISPIWVEPGVQLDAARTEALLREAGDFYRDRQAR